MSYVELTKIRPTDNAVLTSAEWENFQPSKMSAAHSLPNGYMITGLLLERPRIGQQLKVLRLSRNGVKTPGIFMSSVVTSINADELHTQNSIYRLRYADVSPQTLQALITLLTGPVWLGPNFIRGRN